MGHSVLGRKLGMTQVWDSEGTRLAVSVVQVGPCTVTRIKTEDSKDGYNAVQIAFEPIKPRKLTKPQLGHFEKVGVAPHRHLREFRIEAGEVSNYTVGTAYSTEFLKDGYFLDVRGTSKGRGFAGVMKRYGFAGSDRGHGTHEAFRNVGTGGQGSATPGRVPVGKKRPGQYGNHRETTQNVQIVKIDETNRLVYLKGQIPGKPGGLVHLQESVKIPDV